MLQLLNKLLNKLGLKLFLLKGIMTNPIDEKNVELLNNIDFINSCKEVKKYSLLDTNRLANLWEFCKQSNPDGAILEVGSYKGGGALHLSNSCPNRKIFIFDSFEGFKSIDKNLDRNFNMQQFKDTAKGNVENLFKNKNRDAIVTSGFFPESSKGILFPPISFVHLDVDVYEATISSLLFLNNIMTNNSFILLDDCKRNCTGVDKAVNEFLKVSNSWFYLNLFPAQGLLVHKSWLSN